ncbi:flap endonuclease-1 [Candidatus Pacearchaeota archaeon CG10_big_fil_rev_8_21_14_0_10_34_76]|nr:MAG: flap endonuclease-1 [Candidatus Pacearchaeota archaeon CG10_big_fil_rev_8_21_14_0_10_34_76]
MGLQIGDIVSRKEIKFSDLSGKVVAVDAFNAIYQFLSSIRQPDGTPLMDSKDRVTSHLSGLFYRNIALISEGVKLVYVFDGEYHALKGKTHEKRDAAKELAKEKYESARDEEDVFEMGKYAKSLGKLNSEMIRESKELLEAMGVAVVQAPGEGEMQCAQLVKSGEAYAVASQDYDALVVGGKRLIQNLTLARKRRLGNGSFVYIAPEMIEYEKVLNELEIDGDQLICLAILVGSDFNLGGVKGIGPKKALDVVRRRKYPAVIFEEIVERHGELDFNWKDIFEIFKRPNVDDVRLEFPKLNEDKIKEILVREHEFSLERVEKQLDKLRDVRKQAGQKKLF